MTQRNKEETKPSRMKILEQKNLEVQDPFLRQEKEMAR